MTEHRGVDPHYPDVREAPAPGPLLLSVADPARPDAGTEPVVDVGNIQGNLVGFKKDFQTLLFLRIDEPESFRHWLSGFVNDIATAEQVIAFNRLFKGVRDRRGSSGSVKSSWINIAFSHAGLKKLRDDADAFVDSSFRSGVVAQSHTLGDPTVADAEGHPSRWLVRDGEGGAEVLIVIAADTLPDLETEVGRVEVVCAPSRDSRPSDSGASIVFKEQGRSLGGVLTGHEHFGFLDGVSQPGLRGRASERPNDLLTLRQNPNDPNQGKPGQDLIWPGEFVFGYPAEAGSRDATQPGANSLVDGAGNPVAPEWAKDGSYLVFRRLRQDVFKFHSFLRTQSAALELDPAALGARLLGRWASGAPTMRTPDSDNPELADNDCANNHFGFRDPTEPITVATDDYECSDHQHRQSRGDRTGDVCPFAAHIRKAFPRDDLEQDQRRSHRLLRRGLPFGPSSSSTPEVPVEDGIDRGLLFMAYMTSIVGQFEFVTKNWVNNPTFRRPNTGVDPIIGQLQGVDGSRKRSFNVRVADRDHRLTATDEWVIPTGGGYFFVPSLSAIRNELAR